MFADPASATPLWQWIVTTLIALLAGGGGIVALKKSLTKRPAKLDTYLLMEENAGYTILGSGSTYTIRPRTSPPPSAAPCTRGGHDFPRLIVNVTNAGEHTVPVHALRLRFDALRELAPANVTADRLIVRYHSGVSAVAREELESRYALVPDETDGEMVLYRTSGRRALQEIADELGGEALVEFAGVDAEGSAHREIEKTTPVNIRLEPGRPAYAYAISHTVAPRQTIQIPLTIGASRPLFGAGQLTLAFAAGQDHPVCTLNLQLDVPAGTMVVEH